MLVYVAQPNKCETLLRKIHEFQTDIEWVNTYVQENEIPSTSKGWFSNIVVISKNLLLTDI